MSTLYKLYPTADGSDVEWNWTSGVSSDRYVAVQTADDDEQYIYETAFGNRCSFVCEDLPVSPTSVDAVSVALTARCPYNPPTPEASIFAKIGAVRQPSPPFTVQVSDYSTEVITALALAPGDVPWDEATVNASQAGVRHRVLGDGSPDSEELRATFIYLHVLATVAAASPDSSSSLSFLISSLMLASLLGAGLAGNYREGGKLAAEIARRTRGRIQVQPDEYRVWATAAAAIVGGRRYSR